MKQNDTLSIGPFRYVVLDRNGDWALLGWTDKDGVTKELWVNLARKAA